MLTIEESSRENPSQIICRECGSPVTLTIHHDFIEGSCCNRRYAIKHDSVWNCCSEPENGCGYNCKNKIYTK